MMSIVFLHFNFSNIYNKTKKILQSAKKIEEMFRMKLTSKIYFYSMFINVRSL